MVVPGLLCSASTQAPLQGAASQQFCEADGMGSVLGKNTLVILCCRFWEPVWLWYLV